MVTVLKNTCDICGAKNRLIHSGLVDGRFYPDGKLYFVETAKVLCKDCIAMEAKLRTTGAISDYGKIFKKF